MLINGEPAWHISAEDRGLLYGDGLFETLAVCNSIPQHWQRHMQRLELGCTRLAIATPDTELLYREALLLCQSAQHAVLKIIITRGSGGRGYRPLAGMTPTRILSLYPWPDYPASFSVEGVQVRICSTRLGHNPALAGIKHLNRLEQVLARNEWADPDIAEGLLLDSNGNVIEATMSNLFAVRDGVVLTPDLSQCGVAGVTRARILEYCRESGIETVITRLSLQDLGGAQELFLCNSLIGIWPVRQLAETAYLPGPVTRHIAQHV